MKPHVLVVIGDVLHEPWWSISVNGQLETWLKDAQLDPRVEVRHSHGQRLGRLGQSLDRAHERIRWSAHGRKWIPLLDNAWGRPLRDWRPQVKVGTWADRDQTAWSQKMPDLYALQRWKVVSSLSKALEEPDWNYVYFTTASSYVRLEPLLIRIDALPSSRVLAGTEMTEGTTLERFVSGANRVFSRDVVDLIVANRKHYSNDVMEDVGVSRLATSLGIPITAWPSLNLTSIEELEATSDDVLKHHHHFRLRSESRGRRLDVTLMRALHARLVDLEIT